MIIAVEVMGDNILSDNERVLLAECCGTLSLSTLSFVSRLRGREGDEMTEVPGQHPENSVSRDSDRRPGLATPLRETGLMSEAAERWSRGEVEMAPTPAPPVVRDRVLSPKVLIMWATLTLVAYFGVRFVGTVVRHSVQEAIASSARAAKDGSGPDIVILLPNGKKITIHKENPSQRGRVIQGGAAAADPDPDIDVDIGGAATTVPQPTAPAQPEATPSPKAPPAAAKAPPPAAKTSPTRR